MSKLSVEQVRDNINNCQHLQANVTTGRFEGLQSDIKRVVRKKKRFLRSLENRKLQQVRFKQDDIVDRFLKRDAQQPEAELA